MFDYQLLCRVRNQGPILCTSVCDNRTAKVRGIGVLVARGGGATSPQQSDVAKIAYPA